MLDSIRCANRDSYLSCRSIAICDHEQMKLSPEEVKYVASLARLSLSDEEVLRMGEQLSSILEHIAVLERLDTAAIPPTAQVITQSNVMRDDRVTSSLPRDAVLANAPRQTDGYFEVDAILGSAADTDY
jgi:aspartyl-tRNA(Asn)/glutamyl-tRNA(Gln) amidotransferase subunit C